MKDWERLLLVTLLSSLCHVTELCPSKCRCNGNSCNCTWASLDAIPREDIDRSTTDFIASRNHLTELKNNSFASLRLHKLRVIDLDHNYISSIQPHTFDGLHSLKNLSMSHNLIAELHQLTLAQMTELQEIRISSNKLVSLHPELLRQNRLLQVFDASNNRIQIIPPNLFEYCTHLREVYFNSNILTYISSQQFHHTTTLKIANFGKNCIQKLDNQIFNRNKYLSHLSLSDNNIFDIKGDIFKNNCHLTTVDLSMNKLEEILPICQVNCLRGTMTLDIRDNPWGDDKDVQRIIELCRNNEILVVSDRQQTIQNFKISRSRFRRSSVTNGTGTSSSITVSDDVEASVLPGFEGENCSTSAEGRTGNDTLASFNCSVTVSLDASDQNVTVVRFIEYDSPLVLRESTVRGIFFISLECTLAGVIVLRRVLCSRTKTEPNVVDTHELLPISEPKTDTETSATVETHSV